MTDVITQILAAAAATVVGLGIGFLIPYTRRRHSRIVWASLSVPAVAGVVFLPRLSDNATLPIVLYVVGLAVGCIIGFRVVRWPRPDLAEPDDGQAPRTT